MKKLIFSILVFMAVFAVGCAGTQEPGTYGSEQLESEQTGSEQLESEQTGSEQSESEQAESLTDDALKTNETSDISGGLVEDGTDGIEENKDTALSDITAGAGKQTSDIASKTPNEISSGIASKASNETSSGSVSETMAGTLMETTAGTSAETVSHDTRRQAEASEQENDGTPDLKTDQVSGEEVNSTLEDTYDDGLEASPEWVNKLPQAANAGQLVVIAATGGVGATVSMHEKAGDGSFRQILSTSGLIGKGGLGKTKEGDNKTPVGTFHFNKAFGILDDPGCAISYHKVTEYDYWSEDSGHCYNQLVDIRNVEGLDTANSDHIIDSPPFYDYCLNISYNEEGTPGKGSAIFLHCFGTLNYTHGCVAISRDQMKKLMQHVKPDCVVIIDSAKALGI